MSGIYARLNPAEVTLGLAAHLQDVALRGWQAAFPARSKSELLHQFNPDDSQHLEEVQEIYVSHAEVGGLVLARIPDIPNPVGFALAREDVSGNAAVQEFKRQYRPEKVYAWLRHICVDPDYQGLGHGKGLVVAALEVFKPQQIPTAYIFSENNLALQAASRLGFEKTPPNQEPRIDSNFFGAGNAPAEQFRFMAASVESVISAARS